MEAAPQEGLKGTASEGPKKVQQNSREALPPAGGDMDRSTDDDTVHSARIRQMKKGGSGNASHYNYGTVHLPLEKNVVFLHPKCFSVGPAPPCGEGVVYLCSTPALTKRGRFFAEDFAQRFLT